MGRGGRPRLPGGAAQGHHARLHRAAGRDVRGAGAKVHGQERAVPDVPDQQPDVRDRHVQPAAGMLAGHRHRPGPQARQDGGAGHGRPDHVVLPVPRPGRRVRVGHGRLPGRLLPRRPVHAHPESRRLRPAGHASGARPPGRRAVGAREQLPRLHFRHGWLSGRQRPFATPRQTM